MAMVLTGKCTNRPIGKDIIYNIFIRNECNKERNVKKEEKKLAYVSLHTRTGQFQASNITSRGKRGIRGYFFSILCSLFSMNAFPSG